VSRGGHRQPRVRADRLTWAFVTGAPAASRGARTPVVGYESSASAQRQFWAELHRLMRGGGKRWCDVGAGAKPVLATAAVQRWELDYVLLDPSQEQLDRAPRGYEQFCGSILDPSAVSALLARGGAFDVVISRWTAEHVTDGRRFHEAVFELLVPGGTAVHFFPTLYSLPFLANRVLPPALSSAILFRIDEGRSSKFPPHYDWCRGPSAKQLRRLEGIGYTVQRYIGYFGHNFYSRIRPLHAAHRALGEMLIAHPVPALTSFALVVLERPA
jgi:SAM-dependent methyltransferase